MHSQSLHDLESDILPLQPETETRPWLCGIEHLHTNACLHSVNAENSSDCLFGTHM
jgi:hypothetical protein